MNSQKIYHIVHLDNLENIYADGFLYSDSYMTNANKNVTNVGMSNIKERRRGKSLSSYPEICVGDCVPFYFAPRSVMLYLLHRSNHLELDYSEGQVPIVHLVADLKRTIHWAKANGLKWVFTDSNAGSLYFEDYSDVRDLEKIDWDAVHAYDWRLPEIREKKQAEFLIENQFSWHLVEGVAIHPIIEVESIERLIGDSVPVKPMPNWYY